MDIQTEKLNLIQWLSSLSDKRVITQLLSIQESSTGEPVSISNEEKDGIDIGLKSISDGRSKSHEEVIRITKEKYSNLSS